VVPTVLAPRFLAASLTIREASSGEAWTGFQPGLSIGLHMCVVKNPKPVYQSSLAETLMAKSATV